MKSKMCFIIMFLTSLNFLLAQVNNPKYEEKLKAIQLPQDSIETMTTENLIHAYLNFPLTGVINAYDNKQLGFLRVCEFFNGLRELLNRKDIGPVLIKYYEKMKPDDYDESWTLLKKGKFAVDFAFIELLIAQEKVLNSLNIDQTKQLLQLLLTKIDKKNNNINIHGLYGLEFTSYTISKLVYYKTNINTRNKLLSIHGMEKFIEGNRIDKENIPLIINITKSYLSDI